MADRMVLNIKVDRELYDYIAATAEEIGQDRSIGDYVRDLIEQDRDQAYARFHEAHRAEIEAAFAQPLETYRYVTAEDVIARHRLRD